MAEYTVPLKKRAQIADSTMAFWFDMAGTDFVFRAGQYVDIILQDPPETDAEGNKRDFSIAHAPRAPEARDAVMIATRMRPTAFKNSLRKMPLGTHIKIKGPSGSFTLHTDGTRHAIFLAGGIGITPMRSMIEAAILQKLPHELYLFYSNRTPGSATFLADFERWSRKHKQFHFIPTITDSNDAAWKYERGRITGELIRRHVSNLAKPRYYIAGPPAMVSGMWQTLIAAGVSEDDVKTEEFAGY